MRAGVFAACFAALFASSAASEQCRQALALGLDVSGSVDSREYQMQLEGLAAALSHPEIKGALLSMPSAIVSLAVFEWSGPNDQNLLVPWSDIATEQDLNAVLQRILGTQRSATDQSTALGEAMLFGTALLEQKRSCWVRTLDISGDGKSNTGVPPQAIEDRAFEDMTINALVIGADPLDHGDSRQAEIGELSSYFNAYVIHGATSFVEVALGFEDYERAMVRKLKRELQGFAVSDLTDQ